MFRRAQGNQNLSLGTLRHVISNKMVSDRHKQLAEGLNAVLKTARPKLFRRASVISWGKDDLKMTRTAADINLKEFMLTVQQQKVR